MKKLLIFISFIGLALTITPSILAFKGIITLKTHFWLMGIGMVLWFATAPLTSGLVADLFGNFRMGTIMGLTMSCHVIGMATGAYAGGIIFEKTGSYYSFFLIQAILEFIAAIFAFMISASQARASRKSSF